MQSTDLYIRWMEWPQAHRKAIISLAVLLPLLNLAWAVRAWKRDQDGTYTNGPFLAAPSLDSVGEGPVSTAPALEVAKEYPGTTLGEHALALTVEAVSTQGQYSEAYQMFSDFLNTYPDSALVTQAKVGVAARPEAEGKTSEAIFQYLEIGVANILS